MSLTENGFTMPVAPMYGGNGGFGNWGDSFWVIILLLFCFNGGWGGGFGGGFDGGLYPWMNQAQMTQTGFDQAALQSTLAGINSSIVNGFSSSEVANCNRAMNEMERSFATQTAVTGGLTNLSSQLAQCCCDNRQAISDLRYNVATENCADRQAISDGVRDIIASNTANTQMILDKMCQQEIDALKAQNQALQTQVNLANLQASQTAQTATLQAGQRALANEVEQYIAPNPKPCYVVQSPYCCNQSYYGCNG